MLAIISSRPEEIDLLRSRSQVNEAETVDGIRFYRGRLNEAEILLADAGAAKGGIVAAGQIGIDRFGADVIIFIGTAAPLVPYLQHGDMVVAQGLMQVGESLRTVPDAPRSDKYTSMIYADAGMIRQTYQAYESLFLGRSDRPELTAGAVVSVDSGVFDRKSSGRLRREYGAVAVDKEGASAAQVCVMKGRAFLAIYTIVDPPTLAGRAPFDEHMTAFPGRIVDMVEAVATTSQTEPAIR